MRRHVLALSIPSLLLILAGCGTADSDPVSPAPSPSDRELGRLLGAERFCILVEDDFATQADAILADYGLRSVRQYGGGRLLLAEGRPDRVAMQEDPRIDAVQFDGFTVLSQPVELTMSFFEGDWVDDLSGQDALARLDLPKVHRRATGKGVRVAVLDTGLDPTHPLLAPRVELLSTTNPLGSIEVATGADSDGDGWMDEAFGHGTHVAGIVAAIAPDATIVPIRVLDSDGVGSAYELAIGLYEALEAKCEVVNMSLVLDGESDVVEVVLEELDRAGVIVVGAAGNQPGDVWYPASDDDVLGIAATGATPRIAPFSAAGGASLAAPGVGVYSAYPGGGGAFATGTSMASAVVAGAAAVVLERTRSAERTEILLQETSTRLPEVDDGNGELSLLRVLEALTRPNARQQVHELPQP